jgi:DNA-binding transcriptional ArsR family regulator
MVRNWDTVRAILLKLEAVETAHTTLTLDQVDGIDSQEVGYHMMLLKEAGLIEANVLKSSSGDGAIATALARKLTWEGHEFLDKIRDPSMWGKIKAKVKEKSLDLTFDSIKTAAAVLIKAALS